MNTHTSYPRKTNGNLEEIKNHLTKEYIFFSETVDRLRIEIDIAVQNMEKFSYLIKEIDYLIKEKEDKQMSEKFGMFGNGLEKD